MGQPQRQAETEQIRQTRAQAPTEAWLRLVAIVESSQDAIIGKDLDGIITDWNKGAERLYGYSPDEVIGKPISLLMPPDRVDDFAEIMGKIKNGERVDHFETERQKKNGTRVAVSLTISPIIDADGRIVGASAIARDITGRKRSEEAIRESEEMLRMAAQAGNMFAYEWDAATDTIVRSEGVTRVLGGDEKTHTTGKHILSMVPPEDRERLIAAIAQLSPENPFLRISYRMVRPDGRVIWVNRSSRAYFDARGKMLRIVGMLADVTELKQSEQALIEANEHLLEANQRIEKLLEQLERENLYLQKEIIVERSHQEVVGKTDALRRVLMQAEQVAPTNSAVLLLGETGTGKELIARAIHRSSKRKDRLMVKVNCAALPASLVENELFGREKGAYTGALTREMGRFELANESTIFLDEIGELPLELQGKLLRVLQEGEFERLGSSRTIRVDVRVIAATSRDLEAAVRDGKFREDLYYRLNVFPIRIPPLRDRKEDIPMLTWHFLRDLGSRMGREIESVRGSTMTAFQNYSWPGNVRELRNVIERHLITNLGPAFEAELPAAVRTPSLFGGTAEEEERNHILRVLERTGWRIRGEAGAAEILALKPTTLESRMKKLGISRNSRSAMS